jgi:hypothetical protein
VSGWLLVLLSVHTVEPAGAFVREATQVGPFATKAACEAAAESIAVAAEVKAKWRDELRRLNPHVCVRIGEETT